MLIDSHCHLDAEEFDTDRAAVVTRARAAGVGHVVVPAISAAHWPRLKATCGAFPDVHAAYGLHPMFMDEHRPEHIDELRQWLKRERPCAVGECGLDFFHDRTQAEAQQHFLMAQLKLAREFDLPVILHARKALDEVMAAIRRVGGGRGVVHSFSGSRQQAETLWQHGFYLGIGGPVTYPRAQRLREIVRTMPLEFLLLETDAPDQPDSSNRGQRNEPARLPTVAQTIADLREAPIETITSHTTANACRLFGLGVG